MWLIRTFSLGILSIITLLSCGPGWECKPDVGTKPTCDDPCKLLVTNNSTSHGFCERQTTRYTCLCDSGLGALQALSVSPGTLSPNFASWQKSYSVVLSTAVTEIQVTAVSKWPNAVITVNGSQASSGSPVSILLSQASTSIRVTHTVAQAAPWEYVIDISRSAVLTDMGVRD
jgi:hypothetical protein